MANAIDIVVNATDKASGKLKGIGKAFDSIQSKAQKASGIAVAGLAVITGAVGAVAVAGVKYNAMLESSNARWKTLTGSSKGAKKQMDWIAKYAKDSPFDYQGVDETATALNGYGLELKEVNKWIPMLGDVASVMGGGTDTVKGLGLAIGQMNAKGKLSAQEMNQLAERGVNAWGMLADGMGLPVSQVQKLSSEGKILAKDALPLIYKGMEKAFGGGTAEFMKSTAGQADQAQEAFSELAGALTSGAYDWFGATVLPLVNSGLEKLTAIFSGGLLEGFTNLWNSSAQAKLAFVVLAGVIMGLLLVAFFALAPAIGSAVLAFAPFLLVGLAVAGLAFIIMQYWEPIKAFFVNTFGGLWTAFSGFFTSMWALVQPILAVVVSYILSKVTELSAFWSEHWGAIKEAFVNIWTFISGFIQGALGVILAIFKFIFPAIKFIVMSVWENIKGLIDGALKFIMGIVQVFTGLFTGNWSMLWSGIKDMFWGAIQFIWNYVQLFFGAKILGVLGKFAGSGLKYIKGFASKAGSAIGSFVSKVFGFFTKMVSNVLSKIGSWVSGMVSKVDDFVYKILGKIANFNVDLALKFAKGWEALKALVKTALKGVVDVITGMLTSFKNAGKGLIDAFTGGISSAFGKAKDAVSGGLSKLRNLLPFSPAKEGPLSDLDKSGESFFPTWYEGALKKVPAMGRAIGGAMGSLNNELEKESGMMALETFSGGRSRVVVTHEHKHTGKVRVDGDTSSKSVDIVGENIKSETELTVLEDLRRIARSR